MPDVIRAGERHVPERPASRDVEAYLASIRAQLRAASHPDAPGGTDEKTQP